MVLRTHFGAAKIEKRYRGIACRTDLIRTILLEMLSARKVHKESLDSSLSRRVFQEECLTTDAARGAPR